LKGLAQGYIVTAASLTDHAPGRAGGRAGTIQAVGGILFRLLLYVIGRTTKPFHHHHLHHRLSLFALGGLANAVHFNAAGVIFFMVCLRLASPLQDVAYFPIRCR